MSRTGRDCYIYALVDRRKRGAKAVFYIGKTVNPNARLAQHIRDARRALVKSKKEALIVELADLNIGPHVMILAVSQECKGWEEREAWWIAEYERRGVTLLNIATGGANNPRGHRRWLVTRRIKRLSRKRKENAERKSDHSQKSISEN